MRKADNPGRFANAAPEIKAAAEGYRLVTPHVEYQEKMTLRVGERTFELLRLRNAHSEADTAVWLPQERVLFAASVAIPNSLNNVRPFVTIPDILAATRMLRSLNPEVVVPGHGSFGTTKIFDDSERYYTLLVERVGAMVREGKHANKSGRSCACRSTRAGHTRIACRATSTPLIAQSRPGRASGDLRTELLFLGQDLGRGFWEVCRSRTAAGSRSRSRRASGWGSA